MNLLVALSTGVAYVASVVMMVIDIRTDPHKASMSKEMRSYFDSSVFLTFFILAGKALEARAKLKVSIFFPLYYSRFNDFIDRRRNRYARTVTT
jgi:Cu+-exporting ATPase